MASRLATSASPYLLQHADNPVDWFEWGDEAFAEAARRDVPVLLSVGYAACHWCHVMAHESFEDEATAQDMNAHFVNVKVDREERPDVDAVYMDALTTMTGQGGWPMTVFLTPTGEPFYAGTYFPPVRHGSMPAFRDVLRAISELWRDRRSEVLTQADAVVRRLTAMRPDTASATTPPTAEDLAAAVTTLTRHYDHARGGFGHAPKFPPSMVCEFLLRHHGRTGDADALLMAEGTMRAMASGGIYDQLAGGFARYSVDTNWVVPHFEKMLHDNALLLRVYLHLWRSTGRPLGRRVAGETADFLLRELRTPEGGFASSLDADTEGEEGRFYAWTPDELTAALGDDDARVAAELFGVTAAGTYERGTSTLQLQGAVDDPDRFASIRRRLFEARERRVRPARDDKVVTAWNGLAIAALAEAGALLERPDLSAAAATCAEQVWEGHRVNGRLRRVSRGGVVGEADAVLEDLGDLAEGLLTLYQTSGDVRWLTAATALLDDALDRFSDGAGGFYDTAADAAPLVHRPRDPGDNATPSGHAAVTGALLSAAALTGELRWRDAAAAALAVVATQARDHPRFSGWSLAVAEAWLDGPREVAVVGEPSDPRRALLQRTALLGTAPGCVVGVGDSKSSVPLLAGRSLIDGHPTAYVCRGFVCEAPTTNVEDVGRAVGVVLAVPASSETGGERG